MDESELRIAEDRMPLSSGWISLGEGRGIKWILWNNSVVLQRNEKQSDKWLVTEEVHLAPVALKEVAWRCSQWLNVMDNGRGKANSGKNNGNGKNEVKADGNTSGMNDGSNKEKTNGGVVNG